MFRLKNNPVLISCQTKILRIFFASKLGRQFFLTGGTALAAFYLGHRQSNDLDFFTLKEFDSFWLEKVIAKIAQETSSNVKTKVKTSDYYEVYLENRKEDWIQRLDFIKEQPVVLGKKMVIDGINVDSLENIASNKILIIYGRLEPKDYLDLYFIFKQTNLNFAKLFEKTKQKDTGLHEFYFANLIAEVAELKHFPKTLKPFSKDQLVDFYLKLSQKMLREIKPRPGFTLIEFLIVLAILIITLPTPTSQILPIPTVSPTWTQSCASDNDCPKQYETNSEKITLMAEKT